MHFDEQQQKQHESILTALVNNKITAQTILDYLKLIDVIYLEKGDYVGWLKELDDLDKGGTITGWVIRKLSQEIHALLKETSTISGIPSRFQHIDRAYYQSAIKLLEKEGTVKIYGNVVQLIPTLDDRKKILIERITKARSDLVETFEMTLGDYDRGDNL